MPHLSPVGSLTNLLTDISTGFRRHKDSSVALTGTTLNQGLGGGFRSVQKNVESDSDQPFHDTRSATARLVTKAALLLLLLPRGLCPQTLLLLLLLLFGFRTRRVLRQR